MYLILSSVKLMNRGRICVQSNVWGVGRCFVFVDGLLWYFGVSL